MQTILSILLENEPGSLSRIVGLFSQRAFNIESLTVAAIEDNSLSRITIATTGDHRVIEQITKQVNKLVDVLKISELSNSSHIERELMFVKISLRQFWRYQILRYLLLLKKFISFEKDKI